MEAGPFLIVLLMLLQRWAWLWAQTIIKLSVLSSTDAICAGGGGKGRTSSLEKIKLIKK